MAGIHRPKPNVQVLPHPRAEAELYGNLDEPVGDDQWYSDINLETPLLIIRSLAAGIGILLVFTGIYSLYPLSSSVTNVPLCALKLYVSFFGLTILLLEGKGVLPEHNGLRKWFYTEFHFLHHLRGKGFYYLLIGTLTLSLLSENTSFLVCGSVISLLGVLDLLLAAVPKHQLRERGVPIEALQTTTKTSAHSKKSRRHKTVPLTPSAVGDEAQRLLEEAELEPHEYMETSSTQNIHEDLYVRHYGPISAANPLPNFDMTSYTDPLKLGGHYR